jgi:GMP synthase (glutamine-hydrolysing)
MKRILALQHIPENPPGLVGEVLRDHGIDYQVVQVVSEPIPDPMNYDAVIAFGGSQHIYDEKDYPFSINEDARIREAVQHDLPFLGICYGGQLLAHVLGGLVTHLAQEEVGFVRVEFTEEGKKDPLYAGFSDYLQSFHWHEDVFDVPPEGILLGLSEHGIHQSFRFGRRAYGIQYHVEITPDMLDTWITDFSSEKELAGPYGEAIFQRLKAERPTLYPIYHEHSRHMIENFLKIAELE